MGGDAAFGAASGEQALIEAEFLVELGRERDLAAVLALLINGAAIGLFVRRR